jgi:hypothetical protein
LRPDAAAALRSSQAGDVLAQGRLFIIHTNSIDLSGS